MPHHSLASRRAPYPGELRANMEQQALPFDTTSFKFIEDSHYNRRLKRRHIGVTLFVDNDFAAVRIDYDGRGRPPRRIDMTKRLTEAWNLRKRRPFGDEYSTPDGYVQYLIDIVP